jgi:RNA polymerase sigma factor (sigma-70 family)
MTYKEAKRLLEQIKHKRQLAERIKCEINTLRENYDILACSLGCAGVGKKKTHTGSPVEQIILRVDKKCSELERVLQQILDLEDTLLNAIKTLTAIEQNIVVGYYWKGKTHYQLAKETYYSRETTCRIKRRAIEKIARYMAN